MLELYQSLSHSKWDCTYPVVFVPKYRRKAMFGEIRKYLGPVCSMSWHARNDVESWRAI